jgi:hypothetical protein
LFYLIKKAKKMSKFTIESSPSLKFILTLYFFF